MLILSVTEGGTGKPGAALARSVLRVAARIARRFPERSRDWPTAVVEAVAGATTGHPKSITTIAQLDSYAAVVEFTLRNPFFHATTTSYRGSVKRTLITNRDLDALLRERPHDLDRIIGYAQTRGERFPTTASVDRLREWLDATADASAVGDGWL